VRQSIQIALAAAAITATATALHEAPFASLPAVPIVPHGVVSSTSVPPMFAYGLMPPAMRYASAPQSLALSDASKLTAYFDPFQSNSLEDVASAHPSPTRPQETLPDRAPLSTHRTSISRADAMPERNHSSVATRDADAPPLRPSMAPIVRIQFSAPALAPMAHTFFCLKYPTDCRTHKTVFRGGPVVLTAQRLAELKRINGAVNRAITPEPNTQGLAAEKWLISPKSGECHDYAVTKRHELLARGWPARALLLSEVVTTSGEHHLVLVVRTSEGDLVADNLNGDIRRWSKTPYQWVRIQSPANPTFWSTITSTTVLAKETVLTDAKS
jgi:predicted transglutaminase-like cysteine proteinase